MTGFVYLALLFATLLSARADQPGSPSTRGADTAAKTAFLVQANISWEGPKPLASLFDGKGFELRPGGEFVKVSLVFDPPIAAAKAAVESCGGDFKDGVEFFVLGHPRRIYAEGGGTAVTADLVQEGSTEVRSFAILFRHNEGICVGNLHFIDASGAVIVVKSKSVAVPEAPASTTARSPSEPEQRREMFAKASLEAVLDQEMVSANESEKWIVRLRRDGTFFVFGMNGFDSKSAGRFSALGDFTVVKETKSKLTLKLDGRRFLTAEPWDGFLCGPLCNEHGFTDSRRFIETVTIEKLPGFFMIRNREKRANRALPFADLRVRTSMK